ncbi:hypothetical protein ASPFODRAFT_73516 [Aspergillus luchuensis CBS 106.47]|uniref:Luciferase domain-containing protein n=1 Tax=Aspergillus luchuensis (strain CBS 106.47) TaxID=1137211 RepID=A0A1M3T8C9_ASPLC|nr:hypothetical protein ASPFODRAFT_73516 [Aspergillus luchuensis CBS 106.47]
MLSAIFSIAVRCGQGLTSLVERIPRPNLLATYSICTSLLALAVAWCANDYRKYLRLGPGGPPYNLYGWALITFTIRPFALSPSGSVWTGDYPSIGAHEYILALPPRHGERALLGGIAPHRQLTQHPAPTMKVHVQRLFDNVVKQNSTLLETKLSLYERHNPALFVHPAYRAQSGARLPETVSVSRGEIGHMHPDISVHLYVSPADARVLIEKGWAERHRLARQVPFLGRQHLYNIAGTYLMIYGPRNADEVAVLATILRAAVSFMTGQENVEPIG